MALEDCGNASMTCSMALVGREQAKRQEHGLAGDAELILAIAFGQARDPVRDQIDLRTRYSMNFVEERRTFRRHHDESRRQLGELVHHAALADVRRFEDRVEGGDDRHPELREQRQDVAACLPPRSVLVLERQDVDSVDVQEVGGAPVRDQVRLGDLELDARGYTWRRPASFTASTKQSIFGRAPASASPRSVVNVAMPHWRGR